jgi:hypothetical protein
MNGIEWKDQFNNENILNEVKDKNKNSTDVLLIFHFCFLMNNNILKRKHASSCT